MSDGLNEFLDVHRLMVGPEIPSELRSYSVGCLSPAGQQLLFVPSESVPAFTKSCLKLFTLRLKKAKNTEDLLQAAAEFWCVMIYVLHPLPDGNGRTVKAFLALKLQDFGYRLESFRALEAVEPSQDLRKDIPKVMEIIRATWVRSQPSETPEAAS